MKNVFKSGDKVICVATDGLKSDVPDNYSKKELEIGKEYEVDEFREVYSMRYIEPNVILVGMLFTHPASNFKLKN